MLPVLLSFHIYYQTLLQRTKTQRASHHLRVILPPVDSTGGSSWIWAVACPAHNRHRGPKNRINPSSEDQDGIVASSESSTCCQTHNITWLYSGGLEAFFSTNDTKPKAKYVAKNETVRSYLKMQHSYETVLMPQVKYEMVVWTKSQQTAALRQYPGTSGHPTSAYLTW